MPRKIGGKDSAVESYAEEGGLTKKREQSTDNPNIKIVWRKMSELRPAEYNPRKISASQRASLRAGMEKFGWAGAYAVINVNPERKDVIVSAHQRIRVWQELGHTECPCVEVNLSYDDERELNIRLNKNGGAFDGDLLARFFDMESLLSFGFTGEELAECFRNDDEPDGTEILPDEDENSEFEIPRMEPRLYEHHDYIVFVFEEMHDFLRVLELFNVKKVNGSYSPKNKKIGIGRVIFGKKLLEKLFHDEKKDAGEEATEEQGQSE